MTEPLNNSEILEIIRDSSAAIASLSDHADALEAIGAELVAALQAGRKVLTAGNGGSAAEAMHFSEELVGRYRSDRVSLPGIALVADGTALTCIANDFGYDALFSRQVEGLGQPGDILILFSTSGGSRNLELAVDEARRQDMKVISFLGKGGGKLAGRSDHEIIVAHTKTERIQEVHQLILHIVLECVERMFPAAS